MDFNKEPIAVGVGVNDNTNIFVVERNKGSSKNLRIWEITISKSLRIPVF